ncbi:hypothetical protein [Jannaschia formosa]|uniref:hypothetical protein n=1 Tax=Jannaschia formosa TaxID=2259592 RepID=UPI000E1BFD23|nr:hypothetical protein [Jannaschia formosa]TFL20219.1 hypothetical protein DR046_02430 [Jannaschia formosa]
MRLAALLLLATTAPGLALDLSQCRRITNPSYGGEARHQAMAGDWASWIEWWSQGGVYTDLKVADCGDQRLMTARMREENIKDRRFDRRTASMRAFETYAGRAPAFYDLNDLAAAMDRVAEDVRVEPMLREVCACAALHPDARGGLDAFALE